MNDLFNKQCKSCVGLTEKITLEDALIYLKSLDGWQLSKDGISIFKSFQFKNFTRNMLFINALAFICEKEGHHPDVKFGYNYCEVSFTTHELGGLSENDFICAYKINQLIK